VRYYVLPQATHVGRQRHHGARELFLEFRTMVESLDVLLKRAYVRSPRGFAETEDAEEGNDVFMCEYEYDEGWKRFKRRAYAGEGRGGGADGDGGGGGGGGWALGGGSGDDGSGSGSDGGGESDEEGEAYRPEPDARLAGRRGGAPRRRHGGLELPGADEARVGPRLELWRRSPAGRACRAWSEDGGGGPADPQLAGSRA
jgi:origin recognition complex subunit 1